MDFLNRAFAQISDLFKSMSPGARMMSGMLLVVVVTSLAYLFKSHTSGPDAYLMGGEPFSASQLPAMEAAFSKAGLTNYEIEGNRIRVPRGQQSAYMGALADEGALPPDFGKFLEKAISSGGPFTPRLQQIELLRVAKQNELQLILCRMKGIESAAVIYDEKKDGNFGQRMLSTASVNIKPAGSQPLEEERIPMIRHLVASAFAGLKPEHVSVTDLNGRTYAGGGSGGASAMDDPYISRKKKHEEEWVRKVRESLQFIPGVVVTANVELSLDTAFEESETKLDPKGVIYDAEETTSAKLSEGAALAGRPGIVAQQPGGANQPGAVGAASGSKLSEDSAHVNTKTAIPTRIVKRTQQGLTPLRVKMAVGIPTSYYEKIWREKNPTPDGEDLAKIDAAAVTEIERQVKEDVKTSVVALLPPTDPTKDPFPQVTVTSFQHLTGAPMPVAAVHEKAVAWLGQYWSTVGLAGMALFGLVMLRSMVRSAPATPAPAAGAFDATTPNTLSMVVGDDVNTDRDESPTEDNTPRNRLRRRGVSGPTLREELAVMVKEDPDSAVAVLRNWIGTGA